ncbi:MAG: hypothetical protein AB7N65_27035 [Vicinamibacterales bacterium]
MDGYTADEVRKALLPVASLISKSQKALLKLDSKTWQYAMLQDGLKALRIAHELLDRPAGDVPAMSREDLREALGVLDSMISRVGNTKAFAPGTSAHTLQRNRLKALRIAHGAMRAALERR